MNDEQKRVLENLTRNAEELGLYDTPAAPAPATCPHGYPWGHTGWCDQCAGDLEPAAPAPVAAPAADAIMALADDWAFKHLQDDRDALSAAVERLVQERDYHRLAAADNKAWFDAAKERAERAERERDDALALLTGLQGWLNDERWGTWPYMEGSQIYADKREWLARIDALTQRP